MWGWRRLSFYAFSISAFTLEREKRKEGKREEKKKEERKDKENKKGKGRNGKKGLKKNWHTNLIPRNKRKIKGLGGLLTNLERNECTLIQNTSFSLFLSSTLFPLFVSLVGFPPNKHNQRNNFEGNS